MLFVFLLKAEEVCRTKRFNHFQSIYKLNLRNSLDSMFLKTLNTHSIPSYLYRIKIYDTNSVHFPVVTSEKKIPNEGNVLLFVLFKTFCFTTTHMSTYMQCSRSHIIVVICNLDVIKTKLLVKQFHTSMKQFCSSLPEKICP